MTIDQIYLGNIIVLDHIIIIIFIMISFIITTVKTKEATRRARICVWVHANYISLFVVYNIYIIYKLYVAPSQVKFPLFNLLVFTPNRFVDCSIAKSGIT